MLPVLTIFKSAWILFVKCMMVFLIKYYLFVERFRILGMKLVLKLIFLNNCIYVSYLLTQNRFLRLLNIIEQYETK